VWGKAEGEKRNGNDDGDSLNAKSLTLRLEEQLDFLDTITSARDHGYLNKTKPHSFEPARETHRGCFESEAQQMYLLVFYSPNCQYI